jgi:hypothetical protein
MLMANPTPVNCTLENDIRSSVRREVTSLRRAPETESEMVASSLGATLQRVAGSSTSEIDRLITELQSLRERLESEGKRVQRELVEYACLSQTSMQSTKVISESLAQIKGRR